jgi:hypothetical protein
MWHKRVGRKVLIIIVMVFSGSWTSSIASRFCKAVIVSKGEWEKKRVKREFPIHIVLDKAVYEREV